MRLAAVATYSEEITQENCLVISNLNLISYLCFISFHVTLEDWDLGKLLRG